MLLLHIADIHFNYPICATPQDPDRPFRTRLLQDARDEVRRGGQAVDAILVAGDIAFKGMPEEYVEALAWLTSLANAVGCPAERIFVVPGNHDVDRSIARAPATRNVQGAVKGAASRAAREKELNDQFRDADTGRAIFAPIAAYNNFAARFECQVYSPERMSWTTDLPLGRGVTLRVHGLTSTILSGHCGKDDQPASLYLSPFQTVFDPADNVVNLVLCHHTPNWLLDYDEVDDALRRTQVQLFGHEHRQRITREILFARFNAGAVNPDRNEPGWQPGYNLIKLDVEDRDGRVYLEIQARLRGWQPPDSFQAVIDPLNRSEVHHHSVVLRNVSLAHEPPSISRERPTSVIADCSPHPSPTEEASMAEELTRRLIYKFWELAASDRRDICLRLKLITEQDILLPEYERYGRALRKARELDILAQLSAEIDRAEPRARS